MPFKKGQSGNPKGRGAPWNIIDRARELGPKAIDLLVAMMEDVEADPRIRIDAAKIIIERGYGKPHQSVEMTGPEGEPIKIIFSLKQSGS